MTEQIAAIPAYPKKVVPKSADQEFDDLNREGFATALVQTEDFDGTVIVVRNEESVAVQTEPFREKPTVHRKPPAARACGVKTDVPGTALFDFAFQVQPVVTTLVQKALTQASMEVAEELELEQMKTYLRAFEQKAKRDREAIARLEEAERGKFEEKERIVQEGRRIVAARAEVRAKVMARGFAEWFTWDLQDDVLEVLGRTGYFYDEIEREIQDRFLPWLTSEAEAEIAKADVPSALAEEMFKRADHIIEEQCTVVEINAQIAADQKAGKDDICLRRLIAEDRVARAWRKSKQIKNKPKKKEGSDEEGQDDDSGSGRDSTDASET
jgi:hypothetical protein